ncbi:MAG TPA: tRNA glutamyl-Q(34) synthetase GluQRS, partial [Planctomycetota bacterium]|nr:tRNA glutamyl-Q(34) synthetase GluQRS [Planctomycetota bacterium]
ALGETPPVYGHVPLIVGTDGKRLAKRFGDPQIAALRAKGVSPERLIGVLAEWSGLGDGDATPSCLIPRWSWSRLNHDRIVLTPERLAALA